MRSVKEVVDPADEPTAVQSTKTAQAVFNPFQLPVLLLCLLCFRHPDDIVTTIPPLDETGELNGRNIHA
jgi:hypothetical protein